VNFFFHTSNQKTTEFRYIDFKEKKRKQEINKDFYRRRLCVKVKSSSRSFSNAVGFGLRIPKSN
jgi:hypothetical protein